MDSNSCLKIYESYSAVVEVDYVVIWCRVVNIEKNSLKELDSQTVGYKYFRLWDLWIAIVYKIAFSRDVCVTIFCWTWLFTSCWQKERQLMWLGYENRCYLIENKFLGKWKLNGSLLTWTMKYLADMSYDYMCKNVNMIYSKMLFSWLC